MFQFLRIGVLALACTAAAGQACGQSEKLLFSLGGTLGSFPEFNGNLLMLPNGHILGTALFGRKKPNAGFGVVFEGVPPTKNHPSWHETVIYRFPSAPGGSGPFNGLTLGANGAVFGETNDGGPGSGICGAVFQLTPPPNRSPSGWTESTVHDFVGGAASGCAPYNTQLLYNSNSGVFYGTTYTGGSSNSGTLFELSPNGNGGWTETVLHSFGSAQSDGTNPMGTISQDSNGVIYGTSQHGGTFSAGTVWIYNTTTATFMAIYQFKGGSDGASPAGGVTGPYLASPMTDEYFLVATTEAGGGSPNCAGGCGTVLAIDIPVNIAQTSDVIVHAFQGGADGADPISGIASIGGNFWGVANLGGTTTSYCTFGCGRLFEIQRSGIFHSILTYTPIYNFAGPPDGANPATGLVGDSSGNIYGATQLGGTNDIGGNYFGSLWQFTP